jgi:hypothetical protein
MGGAAYAYGPVGVNLGYGWTSNPSEGFSEGFGARVGLHVPVPFVVAAQTDFYVQLPRRAVLGLDAGVGMAWVPVMTTVLPYAQLGALDASGSGFYGTYGFMIGPDPTNVNYSGRGGGADVPGIAFQKMNGRTTTTAFLMAIIARDRRCPDGYSDCDKPYNWAVASGMAVEFRHRK